MNRYLRLFRLGNGVMGIIGVVISVLLASGTDIGDHAVNIAIACALVIVFMAGGNSLNDYIDIEIDRTAHPERPLPRGEITPDTAKYLGIGCLALACVMSFFLNLESAICVIIAAVLMISYEMFLKQRGFVGNLTIAILTGAIFIFGGAIVGDLTANIVIATMAVLVSIGREIAKDIEDMESDEGRRTLPMIIGVHNATIIAATFFILGPALSVYPFFTDMFGPLYCLVLVADAMFIYASFILRIDAHKAQKTAKFAMMVALIAFVLGVII